MKTTIRFGATLRCDMPGCAALFTTYSVSSLVRKQAAHEGWARLPASQVRTLDGGGDGVE